MSVKELKFDEGPFGTDLKISIEEKKYLFEMTSLRSMFKSEIKWFTITGLSNDKTIQVEPRQQT